jgi:hypothetical protein
MAAHAVRDYEKATRRVVFRLEIVFIARPDYANVGSCSDYKSHRATSLRRNYVCLFTRLATPDNAAYR